MDEGYSKETLNKFLNYLNEKGLVKYQTAKSWSSAVSKLLSDLSEAENADVRTVDIELAGRRVANRESNTISPNTLKTYQNRVRRAIDEFTSWKIDPDNYRPGIFSRSSGGDTTINNSSKSKQKPGDYQKASQAVQSSQSTELPLGYSSALDLSYPLRPDFLAQITIPRDINKLEAKRLGAFILTLSSDYQPE